MSNYNIVLASASPRRAQLIKQLGWQPEIVAVDIDESLKPDESATEYCLRMATEKSEAAVQRLQTTLPIITADTIVVHEGAVLGKPKSTEDAFLTLIKLSNSQHQVYSSVSVYFQGQRLTALSQNDVLMATISHAQIRAYIETGEPMDKAGAYGIQGLAAMWIKHIEGSYSSIMGLPLYETTGLLTKLGIKSPIEL
ncbi:MAG: Maf family protein [Marinicella sp.]